LSVMGFSCGTCRMGSDSATSMVSLGGAWGVGVIGFDDMLQRL
jgi:hypothetical protein